MSHAAKLREKLAALLADRAELGLEMDAAARRGGIDRKEAGRFRRRVEELDMWAEHFRAELRKTIDD